MGRKKERKASDLPGIDRENLLGAEIAQGSLKCGDQGLRNREDHVAAEPKRVIDVLISHAPAPDEER